ncbi:Transposon Ty3-I Gag-Pol polyprotein [Vitis vinifera]|uniref:Transposon Ty3-I Gag-Pol polyprotein n=1 Tax=Vitis vinifera TaxID=29760 RepID=A0A438ENE7_VITVI|nr:Transposon Ty3-I Gag-Pol polyprotein [Vitis vinifera]
MRLSQALPKLTEAGLLTTLAPRPSPQLIPPQFRMDLHCAYHQGPGHETDRCTALRHAVQDLIDQGLVHLGQPSVTTNPLPTHTTHAVPPPANGIHFLDFDEINGHVHMLSEDDSDPEPIMPDVIYEMSRVTLGPRMPAPFRLVPEVASVQAATVEPLILPHYSVRTFFILIPDVEEFQAPRVDDSQTLNVQYILRGGRVMRQPPPTTARPVEGTSAPEEIKVEIATSPGGLIHMMTAGRATCIVFSDDDLPPEGSDHTRPLYISVGCSGRRVPSRSYRAPGPSTSALIAHPFPDSTSLMTLCFLDEIDEHRTFAEIGDIVNGAVPRDEYIAEGIQFAPAPEIVEDVIVADGLFDGPVGLVEGASDFVDPHLSFDVLSRFVSHHDYIFYIDDEITQHDSDDDSSSVSDSNPVDKRVSPAVGDTEIVDFGTADQPREAYLDIFAWSYGDIPGFDPSIVQHRLPLLPYARPVKQKLRRLHPCWSLQVNEEIQKQLSVGFLSMVEYPEWLANVVPVPKNDGKVRVCVDFRDLNKASPKDDFPLPHIDMLVDSTTGHSMLSFIDGFSEYSQVLMALEDMEKTSFITEYGTYCYRVMPFRLKNAGATYQRAATTLFHDMMHQDVEVYVDDMIVKSRDKLDHLAALERFFGRIRQFRLRLNPKKCTFGVTFGKLLGYMVSERGIEVDPDKIIAILDMPAPRTEREVRGFLGRLQYISRFIARLIDIFLAPPTPGRPLLLYLSVSDVALGCMLAQLDDPGKDRAIYYLNPLRYLFDRLALVGRLMRWLVLLTEFDIHYVSQKSIKGSIVADHLASLPVSDGRAIDDDFPDEDVAAMTSLSGWRMYFDGVANHSGYGIGVLLIFPHGDHIPKSVRLAFSDRHPATNNIVEYEACILGLETALELGIRQMEVFGDSNLVLRQIQGEWKTRDTKLRPYHTYLELLVGRFDDLRYTHQPRAQNQFADALATLASMIDIPANSTVHPLLIESRYALTYCCLIEDTEIDDGLPWYHDIYHFLRLGVYPEAATTKDRRALRQLASRFVICGETLYRRSADGMLLLCLDRASTDRVMREVHAGVYGPHMGGHMLARKIMRTGYFWLTMEMDCCQFVQRLWSIDIIRKISPKSSSGHEFILVAIDYFTKVEVDTLVQRYDIRHHRSSTYRPQTNKAIEAANKNVKRILLRMVEISRDWSEKLPFALWAYRTSFRTSIGATPYSLVYGMEAVLPVEIEMGSLRVALEQQIPEANWAQTRFDQLNLLDERRLRAADHVRAYQRKMARAFKKRVKPRPLRIGDLVLKAIRGLIRDPRRKFKPSWSRPYFIRELTPEGAAWLMDLYGNRFSEPTNVDQLKRYYV